MFLVVEKFNGSEYIGISKTLQGYTINEIIDDTLDSATIVVNNSDENFFELWDSVRLGAGNSLKCFLVADIDTKRRNVLNSNLIWQHTISLIETTKYLEKIYCSSMSFTNKSDNLLQQLEKALINAEVLEVGKTPRFRLSNALKDRLANEPMRDFTFEKSTLREILDGMLGALDLRCEVYEITDFNDIVIDYFDKNARNNLIDLGEILGKKSVENLEYLGSDIESYAENAFTGSKSAIYHPSKNGWDTFKTNEATLTTNNAVMSTNFPIEEIKEFIVKCLFQIEYTGDGGSETIISPTYSDFNIISNVVNNEVYDILKNFNEAPPMVSYKTKTLYKENTIYYTRGETRVQFEKVSSLFFTAQNIIAAIRNAIWKSGVVEQFLLANSIPINLDTDYQYVQVNLMSYNILTIAFRAKYIPYINAHTRISKTNYSKVPSTIIDNQSDKTVDLERYGDNLKATVNRLGNKTLTVDKVHHDMEDVWQVQDYTADGYVLTKKTIALHNHIIKTHYEFTKDFASKNERIGIDRAKKIYNIPLENFVRDVLIKEYMIASFDGAIVDNGLSTLFGRIFGGEKLSITNALVRTEFISTDYKWQATTPQSSFVAEGESGDNPANPIYLPPANSFQLGDYGRVKFNVPIDVHPDGYLYAYFEIVIAEGFSDWLELSVAPYAMATSLHFRFRFQDNFSAGMSIENQVIGGKKVIPNPYVNSFGEHNKIRIILLNDKLATRSEAYDDIKHLPKTNINWYDNALKAIDKTYIIEKDAYERMQYVYQLEVLSSDPNIIIGNAIAKLHPMVNDVDYDLQLFASTQYRYSANDTKAKGGSLSQVTWTYDSNVLTLVEKVYPYNPVNFDASVTSWCLADSYGNILVAVNKVGSEIIKNQVRFSHKTSRN